MADAILDWKVACLRTIQTMPPGAGFKEGTTPMQELIWIQDLERDGYITARFRMGYSIEGEKFTNSSIPNMIWDVHFLDKGRQLISDFDSQKTEVKTDVGHEHTLWSYWCLADWGERFGMVSLFCAVFLVGYLSASNHLISRIIDLIRDVKP